jgi:outer membrane protein assembly factor BamB
MGELPPVRWKRSTEGSGITARPIARFNSVRFVGLLAASLIVSGVLGQVGATGGTADASITLKPHVGPPTTRTTVAGTGLHPIEQVLITFDAKQVGEATTDGSGSFSAKVKVPRSAKPGGHTVTATGQPSGLEASAPFLVRTDWKDFHFDLANTGFNPYENVLKPSNVHRLRMKWSFSTGRAVSSPTVANGVVYVGSVDDKLYALDAATGITKWSYTTRDYINSSAAVANGVVYIGSWDRWVYALDADTGAVRWMYPTGDWVDSSPAVANGAVYFGSWDDNVYALDADTGAGRWSYPADAAVASSPAVANGVVYVESDNGFYALDAATGILKWTYPAPGFSSPAVVNGMVYVGSGAGSTGSIYALDAATGALKWSYRTGNRVDSSPAVANGVVYVGSADRNVYALDAATGALKWSYRTGKWITSSSPAVANGVVYVGSLDGKLYALEATTGAKLWSYATGNYVDTSPVVADGIVYFGSHDGTVYAFGLPDPADLITRSGRLRVRRSVRSAGGWRR